MKIWGESKCGWVFSAGYLALAIYLFYQAQTCTGWVCDLVALPAAFPFGFPIAWLTDWLDSWFQFPGHTPTSHFRNWYFILPTVVTNTLFYYWFGKLLGILIRKLRS